MAEHRIQLRGPWEFGTLPVKVDAARLDSPRLEQPLNAGIIKFPLTESIPVDSEAQSLVLSRRFHRPTNLGDEHVFFVLAELMESAQVFLHDESLGRLGDSARIEPGRHRDAPGVEQSDSHRPDSWFELTGKMKPEDVIRVVIPIDGQSQMLPFTSAHLVIVSENDHF